MNDLIILMVNHWNEQLNELYTELSSQKETIVIADNYELYKNKYPKNTLTISPKSNIPMNAEIMGHKNIFFPLFAYIDKIKLYDNVWVINQNIRFNGNWQDFFNTTEASDLLISQYKHYLHCTDYTWWPINSELESIYKNTSKKSLNDFSKNDWVKANFDIFRVSRKLLNFLYREMPKYVDYYDVLVPTLARKFGYEVKNLNKMNLLSEINENKQNMEANKIFRCDMDSVKIYDDIKILYEEIVSAGQSITNSFIKSQYYNFLNKCSIKNQPIHDEIIKDLKNHNIDWSNFYDEISTLLAIDNVISLDKEIFDKYIVTGEVSNVGIYLCFIIRYIKKFGKNDMITKICESLLQDQIYKLDAIKKSYIKDELTYLHEQKVSVRFTDRILHEIQGLPIMNTQYKSISDDKVVKLLTLIDGKINFKYYPF